MYKLFISNTDKLHEYEELLKLFLPTDEFVLLPEEDANRADATFTYDGNKNRLKAQLYQFLREKTGVHPPWGIITGIRPVKMTGELLRKTKEPNQVFNILMDEYLVTRPKALEVMDILLHQQQTVALPSSRSVGIYVGIPFCPTRCSYCSFTSNPWEKDEVERYLDALITEIQYVARAMKEKRWYGESIYIGGGTPTTLSEDQLARLFGQMKESFVNPNLVEYCLEAGRPDTISPENMNLAAQFGINRVSINPQSMHEETLRRIGREHSVKQVYEAFEMARSAKIPCINTDIIAGLPGEGPHDFAKTLSEMIGLKPENITVHTLAMKRTSRLTEGNKNFHFEQGAVVAAMLEDGKQRLREAGYLPYYLYRQKQMAGGLENVGYCLPEFDGLYNIRVMEENQTIIAMGAGGISKAYFPEENRLERIPNVSNYQIYIERLEEMILRKENNLFRRF